MSILDFFPKHLVPRKEQRALLLQIESAWDTTEIFTVTAPTAVGKSLIMYTIAKWAQSRRMSSNILPPTNVLVEQLHDDFPDLTPMYKMDSYQCEDMGVSCATVKETCGSLCRGCVYLGARRSTKQSRIRLMNYYVYMAHKLYADVCLFDEAHQLLDLLQEARDIKLWQHQLGFPSGMRLVADFVQWAQAEIAKAPNEKLSEALRQVIKVRHGAAVSYKTSHRWGREQVALHITPTSTRDVPPWLWPMGKVKKVILLSATISKHDIEELGLSDRRVTYLECGSPIPVENRPIVYEPAYNLGLQYVEHALPALVRRIETLLARHPEKGLIHLPYGLAQQVRGLVTDPRLLFHDKNTKQWALDEFRAASPESGKVLVASGMYEGVDLPYDAARWQLIGKVPYLSLGDARIAHKAAENPNWYAWEAAKRIIQAAGRIVRAPDDKGTSYISDTSFARLWDADVHRAVPLFPTFFKAALRDMRKNKH